MILPKVIPVLGRKKVLSERSFVEIFIKSSMTKEEAQSKCKVSYNVYRASLILYRDKYKDELRAVRARNHSKAMKGTQYGLGIKRAGIKHKIKTLLNEAELRSMVANGKMDTQIAKELNTTEHHVKRNIAHFQIARDVTLPRSLQHLDQNDFDLMDSICPGFRDKARKFSTNPHAFFSALYASLARLSFLIDVIKDFKNSHKYHVKIGTLPRDHITFSSNRCEMKLSHALLANNIPHKRLEPLYKNWMVDFTFPDSKLIVELDGEFHKKDCSTKRRDKKRTKKFTNLGYKILRFDNKRIENHIDDVIEEIKCFLNQESNL